MVSNITGVLKTYEIYRSEEKQRLERPGRAGEQKDTVAISGRAMDYQNVRLALQNIPDVRDEIVSAVKKKYESAQNAVTDYEIADKLIGKI